MDKKQMEEVHKAITDIAGKNGQVPQINIYNSPKRIPLPPNVMVFQTFAYLAATRLKDCSIRVLMLLFSKSAYENFLSMDVLTIAEELKYTERSVIAALNELTANNIIIKVQHPSDKRRNDYFINPTAAWRGNGYTRKKKLEMIDPAQTKLFKEEHSLLPSLRKLTKRKQE